MIHTFSSVSSDAAQDLVAAALDNARANGLNVAIAVVDVQGQVLALLRMDGVAPAVADFALDKAYTAAMVRRSTDAFADRMAEKHGLTLGLSTRPRLLAWGGGLPVCKSGAVVGGIGVSGAKDEEDIACAGAALSAVGFDPAD